MVGCSVRFLSARSLRQQGGRKSEEKKQGQPNLSCCGNALREQLDSGGHKKIGGGLAPKNTEEGFLKRGVRARKGGGSRKRKSEKDGNPSMHFLSGGGELLLPRGGSEP